MVINLTAFLLVLLGKAHRPLNTTKQRVESQRLPTDRSFYCVVVTSTISEFYMNNSYLFWSVWYTIAHEYTFTIT